MGKTNRNEQCPCGSGKKFKNCCADNLIEFPLNTIYEEALQLQKKLLDYALKHYVQEFMELELVYPLFDLEGIDDEDEDIQEMNNFYMKHLIIWAIFNEPLAKGQTIFEEFFKKNSSSILRSKTREIIESWRNAGPTLYLINQVDPEEIVLEDVLTHNHYILPGSYKNGEGDLEIDSLILGTLLNMGNHLAFIGESTSFPAEKTKDLLEAFADELEDYQLDGGFVEEFLQDDFPYLLEELILAMESDLELPELDELEWNTKREMDTVQLLVKGLDQEGYASELVVTAILMWHTYCMQKKPVIRKPEAFAAALEYLITSVGLDGNAPSQKELAVKYSVSAATISKWSNDISTALSK